jgi:prepilin-type N-terminal cleavage/methylation domain-containing protein
MKDKQQEYGFTLVELITILVIASILATAAMMRFLDLSKCSNAAACRMNQHALKKAQILHFTQSYIEGNGQYAESLEALTDFLRDGEIPQCPDNGQYLILPAGEITCTILDHR